MSKVVLENMELSYQYEEELKNLRTNILFTGEDRRVILVTSCTASEGKSTTSFNLARSFADLGKKTILLDADLRKSVAAQKFMEGSASYGLSHILSGQCNVNEAILTTNMRNLYMIVAGLTPPQPSELLSRKIFEKLIENLRKVFDYVIIDGAPLGLVIDSAVIAQQCDGAILVVESGSIKYKFLQETKQKLDNTGCPILGCVLNKVNYKSMPYYSHYGYGKYYKAYEHEKNDQSVGVDKAVAIDEDSLNN